MKRSLSKLIASLDNEQTAQMYENLAISKTRSLSEAIESLLENETLIFDGKNSLFYKRTGLMVWDKFR